MLGTTKTNFLQKTKFYVEIKAVTWNKDSHGLFDYESNQVNMKKMITENPCQILRKENNEIYLEDSRAVDSSKLTDDCNILANITVPSNYSSPSQTNDKFFISPSIKNQTNETFLIVRSLKNKEGVQKGYSIDPGDLIKLGRMEYKVVESRTEASGVKSIPESFGFVIYLDKQALLKNKTKKTCRICLSDDDYTGQDDDLLYVNPCKCKGSCEYVHLICLKQWIAKKVKVKMSGCTVFYKMKKFECEVCKEPLPKAIQIGDNYHYIFNIERPEMPYLILECISKEKKNSQGFYLINFVGQEPIKLGRGHICDIRISDISVSRLHALLKLESDKFVIIDNNSKFGTLVQLKRPFQIHPEKAAIQTGRTVITFALKFHNEVPLASTAATQMSKTSSNKFSVTKRFTTKAFTTTTNATEDKQNLMRSSTSSTLKNFMK